MFGDAALQAAFDADERKLHIEIAINMNPRFLNDSISVEVLSGGDYFGTADQVYNDRLAAPFKRWELGRSKFSDGHGLMDEKVECGWTTEVKSGAGGSFAVSPSIQEIFEERTVYHIRVYGDDAWGDYPVDFTVDLYYGGSYHTECTVTDNDNVDYFYTLPTEREGVTKAKLTVSKWSRENTPCKIYELFAGELILITEEDFYSAYVLEEESYQSDSLPVGKISSNQISLGFYDNGTIANEKMQRNKQVSFRIIAEKDGIFYPIDMGNYYSKEWQRDTLNRMFSVLGLDMLSITAEDEYTSTVQKVKNAYEVLTAIMEASKIPESVYYIDPEFADFNIPVVIFPLTTQQNAIAQIMSLTLGSCYYNRAAGKIHMLGPTASASDGVSQKTFTNLAHVMEGTHEPVELNEIATVFEVYYYELKIATSPENVIESTEETSIEAGQSEEIILKYPSEYLSVDEVSAPSITPTGTGLSVTEWTAYVDHIALTISNPASNLQTVTSITVSGKPVTAITHKYSTEDAAAVAAYGRILFKLDNLLIQSYARAKAIGDALKAEYASLGGKIATNLWGAPYAIIGDTVTVPDKDQNNQVVQIERQEFFIDETGFRHSTLSKKVS